MSKGLRGFAFLIAGLGLVVCGCTGESTDVSAEVNSNYHNKVAGPPPPAGAFQPKGGHAFIGQPMSVGGPSGSMPPGAASGPGH